MDILKVTFRDSFVLFVLVSYVSALVFFYRGTNALAFSHRGTPIRHSSAEAQRVAC